MNKTLVTIAILVLVAIGIILAYSSGWFSSDNTAGSTADSNDTGSMTSSNSESPVDTSSNPSSATSTASGTSGKVVVKEFTIEGKNYSFSPNAITVKKGDTVTITLKNTGGIHDLIIEGYDVGTKRIQGGQSDTFQFLAGKAGTFEFYCSVGEHRAMGMKGTLVVE